MRKTDSFTNTQGDRRFFDRTLGEDPAFLDGISPALRADEIRVPVMLVHGSEDRIADFDQYESMLEALRDVGREPETLAIAGEGHGFQKPEHRAELFERLERFLARHIGTGD